MLKAFIPWTIFIFVIVACVMALWAFKYWWKKDRYTRERFAFSGFSALLGFGFFYLISMFTGTSILNSLVSILGKTLDLEIQSSNLSAWEAVSFFAVFIVLAYVYSQVFKHWNGQKSIAQHEQEQNRETASFIADTLRILHHDKEKLTPYREEAERQTSTLERPSSLAWHDQARQLWLLHQRSYIFDEEYNPARKLWLGQEKDTDTLALLICHHDVPQETEIRELARYAQKVAKERQQANIELILVLKNGQDKPKRKRTGYTISHVTEASLLKDLVDFTDYFAELRKRVERDKLLDSDLTLNDTYTPSNYRLDRNDQVQLCSIEDFIRNWLEENSRRQLAVLGEYGQGKSTAALLLSYHLVERARNNPHTRIPILIELRGKSPRTLTPEELLAIWAYRYNINPKALLHLHMAGRILLIFEGFDEIDLTGDTEIRISHFRRLWDLNYESAKIIITGRPNFFLDDSERKRALGIEDQTQTIYLEPFSLLQIEESLRRVAAQTRTEIVDLAKKDKKFYEIVSRPSLLYIVAILWQEEVLSAKREQINSALVMNLFINQTLQRQQHKHDKRPFMALNTAERAYFMAGIAAYMLAKDLPNQIDKRQLDGAVRLLVEAIPDVVSQNVTTVHDEDSRPLKSQERFDWKNRKTAILEQISNDVRSCGLLVTDLNKDGTFKFAHNSFMEFLQAQIISQSHSMDERERTIGHSISNTWALHIDKIQISEEAIAFFAELLETHLKERGLIEGTAIAAGLLDILVMDMLSIKRTFSNRLKHQAISCGIWLTDKFIGYFGIKKSIVASHIVWVLVCTALLLAVVGSSKVIIAAVTATTTGAVAVVGAFAFITAVACTTMCTAILSANVVAVKSTFVFIGVFTLAAIMAIAFAADVASAGAVTSVVVGVAAFTGTLAGSFIGLMIGFTTGLTSNFFPRQNNYIWRRLRLWFRTCHNLQLESKAINNTVGEGMVALLTEAEVSSGGS